MCLPERAGAEVSECACVIELPDLKVHQSVYSRGMEAARSDNLRRKCLLTLWNSWQTVPSRRVLSGTLLDCTVAVGTAVIFLCAPLVRVQGREKLGSKPLYVLVEYLGH